MNDVAGRIVSSEKITSIFERWPSFHDAEVLELSLRRGTAELGAPSLDATIHVFRMTSEVSATGHFDCDRHTIVVLRFSDVEEVQLENFNHQNALNALEFDFERPDGKVWVGFPGAYGLDGEFVCRSVEVVSADAGIPTRSVYRKAEA